jgi:putative glutamine amidotransferase
VPIVFETPAPHHLYSSRMNRRLLLLLLVGLLSAAAGYFIGQATKGTLPVQNTHEAPRKAPLIGIASLTSDTYVTAVRQAGGIPVVLPNADGNTDRIGEYLHLLDGLIMPGGADIPPSEWGEEPHPTTKLLDENRYRFEKSLITRWIKETKKPLLGICLGSQWINVAHGGSLVQDIPSEFNVVHKDEANPVTHPVTLEPGSRLREIFGEDSFVVNSLHHQAVRRVGEGLRVVAKSPDGIIEATETTDPNRFLIGVQWHPEKLIETDPRQTKIFAALIAAAAQSQMQKEAADE